MFLVKLRLDYYHCHNNIEAVYSPIASPWGTAKAIKQIK